MESVEPSAPMYLSPTANETGNENQKTANAADPLGTKIAEALVRGICALVIVYLGFLVFGGIFTSGWGHTNNWAKEYVGGTAGAFLASLFLMAPISFLPFIGMPRKRIYFGMAAISLLTAHMSVGIALAQEWWVIHKYGANPGRPLYLKRWEPFSHHEIAYIPGHGWTGWD